MRLRSWVVRTFAGGFRVRDGDALAEVHEGALTDAITTIRSVDGEWRRYADDGSYVVLDNNRMAAVMGPAIERLARDGSVTSNPAGTVRIRIIR